MKDLWTNINIIIDRLKNHHTKILILDFDGTLTPIVDHPNKAILSLKTKKLLTKLDRKEGFCLAIVSGRKLEEIKNKIGIPNLIYAGNHGLEGEIFNKKYSFNPTPETKTYLMQILEDLKKIVSKFQGAFIEDKKMVISFHYRLVNMKQIPELKLLIKKLLKPYENSGLVSALINKKVYEIRPKSDWDKGYFSKLIIKEIEKRTKAKAVVFYIGDDLTDEDAFQKLNNEITVRVGKKSGTQAKFYLKNTKETFRFLEWIYSFEK
jgi:trehalose-phosphatase